MAILMAAQAQARIPLLIGSCGQSGGDNGLEWTRDIAIEVAKELNVTPRIAEIRSEQDPQALKLKNAQGKIHPLAPHGPMSDSVLDQCEHIVAAMGPEPYIAAPRRALTLSWAAERPTLPCSLRFPCGEAHQPEPLGMREKSASAVASARSTSSRGGV